MKATADDAFRISLAGVRRNPSVFVKEASERLGRSMMVSQCLHRRESSLGFSESSFLRIISSPGEQLHIPP